MYAGAADVIVCDGFTGNIALKVSEGLVEMMAGLLRDGVDAGSSDGAGVAASAARLFDGFRRRVDDSEYGGVPLLGVAGLALVGHGRSSAQGGAAGRSWRPSASRRPASSRGSSRRSRQQG